MENATVLFATHALVRKLSVNAQLLHNSAQQLLSGLLQHMVASTP
jgi:hypothetical protein